MPWLSSFERDAWEKGRVQAMQENLVMTLQLKFGGAGKRLAPRISEINEAARLRRLLKATVKAENAAEVRQLLSR